MVYMLILLNVKNNGYAWNEQDRCCELNEHMNWEYVELWLSMILNEICLVTYVCLL